MITESVYVLGVDPGKMTGIARFLVPVEGEPVLEWSIEVDEDTFAETIREQLRLFPGIKVVCERYLITVQSAKYGQSPFSLELIGILKQCVRDVGRKAAEVHLQNSSVKKKYLNPALKTLGYWHRGGKGHALDAIRHVLVYLETQYKWQPKGLLS
jgi:hypothetical protein